MHPRSLKYSINSRRYPCLKVLGYYFSRKWPQVTIFQKLKYGFILDPEVFFLQIFDSCCGIAYSFCPAKQIINPKHVPTCPQGHFSVKSSIYNIIFNENNASNTGKEYIELFKWKSMPPTLKNSIELFNELKKLKKYGKLLPIYSKNGLQILLSQLLLALTKWIFEVLGLWAPFGLFWLISRLKLQNLAWADLPN